MNTEETVPNRRNIDASAADITYHEQIIDINCRIFHRNKDSINKKTGTMTTTSKIGARNYYIVMYDFGRMPTTRSHKYMDIMERNTGATPVDKPEKIGSATLVQVEAATKAAPITYKAQRPRPVANRALLIRRRHFISTTAAPVEPSIIERLRAQRNANKVRSIHSNIISTSSHHSILSSLLPRITTTDDEWQDIIMAVT